MTFRKRFLFFAVSALLCAIVSAVLIVLLLNQQTIFLPTSELSHYPGKMFNDLSHIFLPAFSLGALALLCRSLVRVSFANTNLRELSRYFLLAGVFLLLPVLAYLAACSGWLVRPGEWWLRYQFSFDDFLVYYGVFYGVLLLGLFIALLCRKKITFAVCPLSQLRTLCRSWPFQLFLLAALLLMPHWSGSYWLNLLNGEFLLQTPLYVYVPVLVFSTATLCYRRTLQTSRCLYISVLATILFYLFLQGWWHTRLQYFGPLPLAIKPVVCAAAAWLFLWLVWMRRDMEFQFTQLLPGKKTRRYLYALAGLLLLWQFASYYWYGDSRRQEIAWRFIHPQNKGVCVGDISRLPPGQQKFLLRQLRERFVEVYTDPATFPVTTQKDSSGRPILKYPILESRMAAAGLFLSKGYCGCHHSDLGADRTHAYTVWILGRWWHI